MKEETPRRSRMKNGELSSLPGMHPKKTSDTPGASELLPTEGPLLHPEFGRFLPSMRDYHEMRELIYSLRAEVARLTLERDALKLQALAMEKLLDEDQLGMRQPGGAVIKFGFERARRSSSATGKPRLRLNLFTRQRG